jgi:O-methyltransferase involved in polyketide biosynthesis
MDEIILDRVRGGGVELVLNLAAGLDARPWRMDLPANLQWVDVDLPGILGHKVDVLRNERPRCAYEPVMLDLTDGAKRRALFAQLGTRGSRALVVTEGLLVYLEPEQVAALARDLRAQPAFQWWLIDLASPRLLKYIERSWGRNLQSGNAPMKFAPEENTKFFEPHGWREVVYRSMGDEAQRLNRGMRMMWLWRILALFYPRRLKEQMKRFSGIVLLERSLVP